MPTKNPDTRIATIEEEESSFYDYNTGVNNPTTCYYYDGQMSICESYSGYQGERFVMDQTRNTLGARGIDMIEAERVFGPSGDTVMAMGKRQSYPIYDGHGNMLATLVKNGSSYSLQNEKRYDPRGGFTVGSGPGTGLANPSEAYCANLGHKSDAESDFIYMRARYYEPGSGRFISEDPVMSGINFYAYCNNDAVNMVDQSGKEPLGLVIILEIMNQIASANFDKKGKGPLPDSYRIWFKTANGVFQGIVTTWAIKMIQVVLRRTAEAVVRLMATGSGGLAVAQAIGSAIYDIAIILAIDMAMRWDGDALFDVLFNDGDYFKQSHARQP